MSEKLLRNFARTSFRIYADTNERGCADGANDVLRNDVMLRINDVARRANGKLHFCTMTSEKKHLRKQVLFFNEAHLRCMKNEAELRSIKRGFGTRRRKSVLCFMRTKIA